jgi:CubicO group peptidase (beta-lactamase class C family)
VRSAFEGIFSHFGELGAAVAVVEDGRPVVDLWGGFQDEERTRPWERDTLVNVFSVTKGLVSLSLAMLAGRGLLDVDAPVAEYWPEFASQEKHEIKVSELLAHQAGLPALRAPMAADSHVDWGRMVDALAAERPWWPPGRHLGYHAITWGWLAGELVRRVDGRTPGAFLRDEIAVPLELDLHLGTGPELDARIAPIAKSGLMVSRRVLLYWLRSPRWMPLRFRLFTNPPQQKARLDTRAWRAAELPATNGISNARSLARLFGVLASDGEALLPKHALERATHPQARGRDLVFGFQSCFGLGFMLNSPDLGFAPGTRVFGHTGASGAFCFADPDRRLAFAYTPNREQAQSSLLSAPARSLVDAIYRSLEKN